VGHPLAHEALLRPSPDQPPTYSVRSERDFNREAQALFSFSTSVAVKKPPAPPRSNKKRKIEGDASGAEDAGAEYGEVEQPASEEILAQLPPPLLEPEEIPVPRLRARHV